MFKQSNLYVTFSFLPNSTFLKNPGLAFVIEISILFLNFSESFDEGSKDFDFGWGNIRIGHAIGTNCPGCAGEGSGRTHLHHYCAQTFNGQDMRCHFCHPERPDRWEGNSRGAPAYRKWFLCETEQPELSLFDSTTATELFMIIFGTRLTLQQNKKNTLRTNYIFVK